MSQTNSIVIKVGGSLYDLPDLAARLRSVLESLREQRLLLVPGGGAAADIVRDLDRLHGLGQEWSHWLALRALTMNALFLQTLLPNFRLAKWPHLPALAILDPYEFALADEHNPEHLPHTWEVTSDSVAARAAQVLGARELLLLKSVSLADGLGWPAAARAGVVDAHFAKVMEQAPTLRVHVINLRVDWPSGSFGQI
jgi:aspartokinase-like uncharacterized kinase